MKREQRFNRMDTGGIHRRRTTTPEVPPPHFFKLILPTTILDKKLRIPMTFMKDHGDDFASSSIVTLSDPYLKEWKIGLEKSEDDDVWLSEGWEKFMEYYSITKHHVLTFRYEGSSKFHVLIFGMCGSEIKYPHHHHHHHPKPNIKMEREEVISMDSSKNDEDHDHDHDGNDNDYHYAAREEYNIDDDDDDDAYYSSSPSKSPSHMFTPRGRGFTTFMDQGTRRERERGIRGRGGKEKQYNPSSSDFGFRRKRNRHNIVMSESDYSESEEEEANYNYNNNHHHHGRRRRRRRSNGGRYGNGMRVKKEENVEWVSSRETCKSKSYRKRKITARESERVMQAAREYISEFPNFMAVLRPHNFYNSFVYVPAIFASKYLDGRSELITLETWEGKQWSARCIYKRGAGCGRSIGRGWAKFAMDNNIQEGDVCVFEVVSRIDIVLRVGIFRLSDFLDR